MNNNKNDDIIKKIIQESGFSKGNKETLTENDVKKKLESIDRNDAMNKLRSMGLGSIADKLKNVSDRELIDMISKNPALLKKINSYLK